MFARHSCGASINILLARSPAPQSCIRSFSTLSPKPFVVGPSRRLLPHRRITHTPAHRSSFATMAVETPYITLNDGNKMPQVGFGLWKVNNDTCADTVYNAIKTGYRLFDGACGTYTSTFTSLYPNCLWTHCIDRSLCALAGLYRQLQSTSCSDLPVVARNVSAISRNDTLTAQL
jgi:hypothetical protein